MAINYDVPQDKKLLYWIGDKDALAVGEREPDSHEGRSHRSGSVAEGVRRRRRRPR